jgi:predicted transposase YdaD
MATDSSKEQSLPQDHLLPHDRFVRQTFGRLPMAREYFDKHLPATLRPLLDLDTLTLEPESYVGDDLRLHTADLVFSVQLKDTQGQGQPPQKAYLYTLVEHLSSPDPLVSFRLLKYMVAIWDSHLKRRLRLKGRKDRPKLPLIVPFVLYTGRRPFGPQPAFFDLFGAYSPFAQDILTTPPHLLDLTQTSDNTLQTYPLLHPALLMAKYIYDLRHGDLSLLTFLFEKVAELAFQGEEDYARSVVVYGVLAGHIPHKALVTQAIETAFKGDMAMNLLKEFEKDGLKKGLEQGRLEGRIEGLEKVALNLLAEGLPVELIAKATSLTLEQIRNLRTLH